MSSIFSHNSSSYSELIKSKLGKGAFHAALIYKEWFQKGTISSSNPAFKNAKFLFEKIVEITNFTAPLTSKNIHEGNTEKFLLQTHDLLEIESVILPMKAGLTLCVSSQIGCKMGCAFCETGKMGLIRSLSCEEIVSQVFYAKHILKKNIRNIVFMGMGEPLDNYEAVISAIKIFTDPLGLNFGPRNITISTSGLVDKIYRLIDDVEPGIHLAVSVNSPHDAVRNKLMPINKKYNMQALYDAMKAYSLHPKRKILIEYVLIRGFTDSLSNIEDLMSYLQGLNITINLIPYNPQSRDVFQPPEKEAIDLALTLLKQNGFNTFVRGTKGQKIMAACGQLGNLNLRKSKKNLPNVLLN